MRVAVLILALIGAIGAGFLGFKWVSDSQKNAETMEKLEQLQKQMKEAGGKEGADVMGKLMGVDNFEAKLAEYKSLVTAAYLLCAGAVVGLITAVLIFARTIPGVVGGIILIVCSAAPGAFAPKSMVFSGLLIVAGLLALTIKAPQPVARPVEDLN